MSTNPLFPTSDDTTANPRQAVTGYVLPGRGSVYTAQAGANEAADVIRAKLARIYEEEPDPFAEEQTAETAVHRSKHQQFMHELSTSGKSLAEVQTAWHAYYAELSDTEKHEVWREFYEASGTNAPPQPAIAAAEPEPIRPTPAPSRPQHLHPATLSQAYTIHPETVHAAKPLPPTSAGLLPTMPHIIVSAPARSLPTSDRRPAAAIRQTIRHKVSAGGKLRVKHHVQSLLFGLAIGLVTVVVLLFGFFNEVIIAPFIQPSRTAGATPIIVNPSDITASSTPEIIIPKIHLQIPVDFSQTTTDEATIENALEKGIVHYPSTVKPGQRGNAAFFGHSSNNIFNPGKYKFAFVLLHELEPGDTFYITYSGKVYIYQVFSKRVVDPSEISVLNNLSGHSATATLITCDPPGTSLHRLVVVGDQISPDPSDNSSGVNSSNVSVTSADLPGNAPSLWSRLWNAVF